MDDEPKVRIDHFPAIRCRRVGDAGCDAVDVLRKIGRDRGVLSKPVVQKRNLARNLTGIRNKQGAVFQGGGHMTLVYVIHLTNRRLREETTVGTAVPCPVWVPRP